VNQRGAPSNNSRSEAARYSRRSILRSEWMVLSVKRRVADAARYVDGERLALSPQCGFASTAAGNPITEAEMRAKLALVVEAARAIWG
jgi:hypothetical protein